MTATPKDEARELLEAFVAVEPWEDEPAELDGTRDCHHCAGWLKKDGTIGFAHQSECPWQLAKYYLEHTW